MNLKAFNKETRRLELAVGLWRAYRPAGDDREWSELSPEEVGCWCSCAAYVENMLSRRRR